MAKLINPVYFIGGQEIASNSLDVSYGDLVTITDGFLVKSVATGKVDGVSVETKVFDSDNQTVKWAKLEFARLGDESLVEIAVSAGLTQALVGKTFNLTAGWIVDGATSATWVQVTCRKFISATLGQFVRA